MIVLIEWGNGTSPEFRGAHTEDVVLLVASSCEQHALHLPVATDNILGTAIARLCAEKAERNIYLLPTLPIGFSEHHMSFPGTLTLGQETIVSIVMDIARCVAASGFRKMVILNSHGGNTASLSFAVNKIGYTFTDLEVCLIKYWDFISEEIKSIRESEMGGMGHAGELETSLMLAIAPEKVKEFSTLPYMAAHGNRWFNPDMFAKKLVVAFKRFEDYSKDGNVGMAQYATREKGVQLLQLITEKLADFLDHYFV